MRPNRSFVLVLVLVVFLVPAPRAQEESPEEGLAISGPDFNKSPLLQEASVVQPIPPRTLSNMLPKSFAGLPQTKADGKVKWLGPAGQTRVEALYASGSTTVKVLVLDPAGLPPGGREYLPRLAEGESVESSGGERRGLRLGDFDATGEELAVGDYARVQVFAGPRLRISAESIKGLSLEELFEGMKSLDVGAFAALAPTAPPDLREKLGQTPGQ